MCDRRQRIGLTFGRGERLGDSARHLLGALNSFIAGLHELKRRAEAVGETFEYPCVFDIERRTLAVCRHPERAKRKTVHPFKGYHESFDELGISSSQGWVKAARMGERLRPVQVESETARAVI